MNLVIEISFWDSSSAVLTFFGTLYCLYKFYRDNWCGGIEEKKNLPSEIRTSQIYFLYFIKPLFGNHNRPTCLSILLPHVWARKKES